MNAEDDERNNLKYYFRILIQKIKQFINKVHINN